MDKDDNYICTLDDKTLKIAMEELNEDPKDRMAAVEALKEWILKQPHFNISKSRLGMFVSHVANASFILFLGYFGGTECLPY